MIYSLSMLLFFGLGISASLMHLTIPLLEAKDTKSYALIPLMFLIGITIGARGNCLALLKEIGPRVVFVPLAVIAGSIVGGMAVSAVFRDSIAEGVIVASGSGYFSLSSILVSKLVSAKLSAVTLLANLLRLLLTLTLAPLLVRYFGKFAPIASSAATSMDLSIPTIMRTIGPEFAMISVFSGAFITFLLPFYLPAIIKLLT